MFGGDLVPDMDYRSLSLALQNRALRKFISRKLIHYILGVEQRTSGSGLIQIIIPDYF